MTATGSHVYFYSLRGAQPSYEGAKEPFLVKNHLQPPQKCPFPGPGTGIFSCRTEFFQKSLVSSGKML